MPAYRYVCTECGGETKVWATPSDYEKGLKVVCPKCGSPKMVRIFGNLMVMRKGWNTTPSCGPRAGPGCCGR